MKKAQINPGDSQRKVSWPDNSPDSMGDGMTDRIRKDGHSLAGDSGTDYIGKSFLEHVEEYPILVEGVEISDFLKSMVQDMAATLMDFETNMVGIIDDSYSESSNFDKSLGAAVVSIGKSVNDVTERVNQLESVTSMAKSMGMAPSSVRYMEKPGNQEAPSPNDVLDALVKSAEAGLISASDVIKFETLGTLEPHVARKIGLPV